MAFQPRAQGGSTNMVSGGAPPPMMMFNPSQFSQPPPPQIPLPTSPPEASTPSSNALPDSNHYQQAVVPSQAAAGGSFQENQPFQQNMSTPNQSQQQPDSTSNVYQNAGIYHNYNSVGQPVVQQPQYESPNWNYGSQNINNIPSYQPPQSNEQQYPASTFNGYDQNPGNSYGTYNSGETVQNASPKHEPYQSHPGPFIQATVDSANSSEYVEGGPTPYANEGNTFQGNILAPASLDHSNHPVPQSTVASDHGPSRETSVTHGNTEPAMFPTNGIFQTNSVHQYGHISQQQPIQFSNQPTMTVDPYSKQGYEPKDYAESTGNIHSNNINPSGLWGRNDNVNYNEPALSTFGGIHDASLGTGSTQAQPDIVSATSSTASPSSLQQFPTTSFGGDSLNLPAPNIHQPLNAQMAGSSNEINGATNFYPELQSDQSPFVPNVTHGDHHQPPQSLPPLYEPYQTSNDPPTTMMNKAGYGLGPDVITAVSSTNITNTSQINSSSSQYHNINPQEMQGTTQNGLTKQVESAIAEEHVWEPNLIEEETNQASSKLASRIDEMRKAKESSQLLPLENTGETPIYSLTPGSNQPEHVSGTSNMNSTLENFTESSQDTTPEHKPLQQGNVPLGSHAEHYAYYQQFENMSTEKTGQHSGNQAHVHPTSVYNRTPDVIAAQQPTQSPGVPPSSDRNLYMQTGHLNEQDDVLNHEPSAYSGEHSRNVDSSNVHPVFSQPGMHRPTNLPDGGNEVPILAPKTVRSNLSSERHGVESAQDIDIPLDRLVLGESEAAPDQQQSTVVHSLYSSQQPLSDVTNMNWNVWNSGQANRFVTGEDDRRVPGAASNDDQGNLAAAPPVSMQQSASLPPVVYSTIQTPQATSIVHTSSNDNILSPMADGILIGTAYDTKELEVRREAVGSDRRDESVMGPPLAPYSLSALSPNNQREVPTGEDAPVSLQSSLIPGAFPQLDNHGGVLAKENEESMAKNMDLSAAQGASNALNNTSNHTKSQKYKNRKNVEDKESDYRTGHGKSKKHSKGRRSSTPDLERDSVRHRHRSPHSSSSSSSNEERSSNESYSDERNREKKRYNKKYTSSGKDRRGEKSKKESETHRSSRHFNDSRRSDLDTTREKLRHVDRHKRKSETGGYRDDNRRGTTQSRYDRDYRKGYSINQPPRGYRAGSYRDREHEYYGGYNEERYYDSRPSSRGANSDYYPIYEGQNYPYMHGHNSSYTQFMYPKLPTTDQQQPNILDPTRLEAFRKNWEYYKMWNPQEQENLRLTNPVKYDNLMSYYRLYGNQLPSSSMRPPSSTNNSIKSDSAVRSPNAQPLATSQTINSLSNIGNNSTIHPPGDHNTDPTNFRPTPNVSSVIDDGIHGGYSTEVAGICDQISRLAQEMPTVEEEGQYIPITGMNEPKISDNPMYDPNQRLTPAKFTAPHVKAIFSARGLFAKIDAKSPLDGQSATVEVHGLKSILSVMPDFKELRGFPGPLVPGRTHKGEVIQFCQNKIQNAKLKQSPNTEIVDPQSYILLWELLILLLRQKSAIDGCDIAELLLKDREDVHKPYGTPIQNSILTRTSDIENKELSSNIESDHLSDVSQSGTEDSENGVKIKQERSLITKSEKEQSSIDVEAHVVKFRDYLLFGHKKEGLEYAMQNGLWGHALFLASKMDERSYSNVMLRFANGLVVNDPLQTLYQMMSGRQPIAVKECADSTWGDWRPHLAMILSNSKSAKQDLDIRSIKTLGDTLSDKGFLYAGQFCYLMAELEFGSYENKNSKLVLIGGDRSLLFDAFSTNEAIQATEIYEYARKLSNPDQMIPTLQYYKYIYAVRLIDYGLANEALHYLEEVAAHIVKRPGEVHGDNGLDYSVFIGNILMLAEQLKYLDPSYLMRDGEFSEMSDPEWLIAFRNYVDCYINSKPFESNYNADVGDLGHTVGNQIPETPSPNDNGVSLGVHYPEYNHDSTNVQYNPSGNIEHSQFPQQTYSSNYNDRTMNMYDPQSTYTPAYDIPLQQPSMEAIDNQHVRQASPFFINTDGTNASNLQMSPSPETSDVIGSSSNCGSLQSSPVHSVPSRYQEPLSDPSHVSESSNYFGRSNFPPEMSTTDTNMVPTNEPTSSPNKENTPSRKPQEKSAKSASANKQKSSGLFGWVKGKLGVIDDGIHMGDNLSLYYDEKLGKWVDPNADPNEANGLNAKPPPMDIHLNSSSNNAPKPTSNSGGLFAPPAPNGGNKFSAGGLPKRRGVVDVFKNSQTNSTSQGPPNIPQKLSPPMMAPPMMATPIMAPSVMAVPSENTLAQAPFMIPGPVSNGDMPRQEQVQPEKVNHQENANNSVSASDAPPMFFNPSQFSNQAIQTPNM